MKPPIVEVMRRRGPRPPEPPSMPMPPAVTQALAAIVRDMCDVPRDCIRDPAELLHWLRRMAGRVEGVGRMRVASSNTSGFPKLTNVPKSCPASAVTPRDLAEAVFGGAPKGTMKPVERRTITSRKGRTVKVETRRARAAGQMELGL